MTATVGGVRVRFHRHRLDLELASGANPEADPLRRERARELVGERSRHHLAERLERLLVEAETPSHGLSSRVPLARAAIRDSRFDLETIIERLKAPTGIGAQAVAMISRLVTDGAGPVYGNGPAQSRRLQEALAAADDAIDRGLVPVG